jgi:amino acid transporter
VGTRIADRMAKQAVREGVPLGPRPARGSLLKRVLVGRSQPSWRMEHTLLPKLLALPIFSSDALSSVAYATEQILVVLLAASAAARHLAFSIAVAIGGLMAVVVASYWQICRGYPRGGGGYVVTRDNFGAGPSLVAASALLIDFVLTVAVSVVAGVVAITSLEPGLVAYRVELSVAFVVILTLANLRGVRESGVLFAVPTYGFILSILATVALGLGRCVAGGCPQAAPVPQLAGLAKTAAPIGLFIILHAFSSGATALTGVEAIATAVPAFRRPQARNAQRTLGAMGVIAVTMFLGISFLATHAGVTVSDRRSVMAQITDAVFHGGPAFAIVQVFTTAILVLAANTSYQAFPRLLAILAEDDYVPRQFRNLGDRLVFSNGIVVLAGLAIALIVAFDADLDRLIQLYVVGVFTDFTLSQAGMVRRWHRLRREERGWRRRAFFNALGAVCTGGVLLVTIITKFVHGAWLVIAAAPLIILLFRAVNRHYRAVAQQLSQRHVPVRSGAENHVVLLVPDLSPATAEALGYVRSFRPPDLRALFVGVRGTPDVRADEWRAFCHGGPALETLEGHGHDLLDRLNVYLDRLSVSEKDFVTIVIPETISEPGLSYLIRRRDLVRLKAGLLRRPRVVVTDVPVVVQDGGPVGVDGQPLTPTRTVALVFVSAVHDATARAVNYARSLRATETRAVFFAFQPQQAVPVVEAWGDRGFDVPLDVVEAPFRDLRMPVLEEVRRVTERPDSVAAVIMPELVVNRWRHLLLHNQTPLFVKRLLIFEPRVILSSVPYQLD